MIIKKPDDKSYIEADLLDILAQKPKNQQAKEALYKFRAGEKAEREAQYLINFDFSASENSMVIHDLRLEVNGRTAQIDHLVINRTMHVFVFETKSFHCNVRISEQGEFASWNNWKKQYQGIPSPIKQNQRHIEVLKEAFEQIALPKRAGFKLTPTFHSCVLISPKATITRPRVFDTSNVIKADCIKDHYDDAFDKMGLFSLSKTVSKTVSKEAIKKVAEDLCKLHKPASLDYWKQLGLEKKREPQPQLGLGQLCAKCQSNNISIAYGRYGYYFKCADCDGNTAIKISCGHSEHKERIRKDGNNFFRECSKCGSSSLFFTNREMETTNS